MMKGKESGKTISIEMFWASEPGLFLISRHALHVAFGDAGVIVSNQQEDDVK